MQPTNKFLLLFFSFFFSFSYANPVAMNNQDSTLNGNKNVLAITPPMGFTTWARFMCARMVKLEMESPVNKIGDFSPPLNEITGRPSYSFQHFMLSQAQSIKKSGLQKSGYNYINVDDCWMDQTRNPKNDSLQGARTWGYGSEDPNIKTSAPGFASDLSDYVSFLHRMDFKVGLYSSSGYRTCQFYPGSAGHEKQDAEIYARWGIDFLKYDNCDYSENDSITYYKYWPSNSIPKAKSNYDKKSLFIIMSQALASATRGNSVKIVFAESIPAAYGLKELQLYDTMGWVSELGQMWRVAGDIRNYQINGITHLPVSPWVTEGGYAAGIYPSFLAGLALARYTSPGNWNDIDQILIGDNGLNNTEESSQMALWSILGAPLIISTDARKFDPEYLQWLRNNSKNNIRWVDGDRTLAEHLISSIAILTNPDVVAIDQDPLGAPGYRVMQTDTRLDNGIDVIARHLKDSSLAILVLNKGINKTSITLPLSQLGFSDALQQKCTISARDLWHQRAVSLTGDVINTGDLPAHGNKFYRISARCNNKIFTAEAIGEVAPSASINYCLTASKDSVNAILSLQICHGSSMQRWSYDNIGHHLTLSDKRLCISSEQGGTLQFCKAGDNKQILDYYQNGAIATYLNSKHTASPATGALCLDVSSGMYKPSNRVIFYPCGDNKALNGLSQTQVNQSWTLPLSGPLSVIKL